MAQKTYTVTVQAPVSGFTPQPGYYVEPTSGSFVDGATITITGSGFGVGPTISKTMLDTVGPNYSGIVEGMLVPVGPTHVFTAQGGPRPATVFRGTNPRHSRSSWSYGSSIPATETDHRASLGWPSIFSAQPLTQDTLYVAAWFWFDSTVAVPNHSSKFYRVWDLHDGTGTRTSWTHESIVYTNAADQNTPGATNGVADIGSTIPTPQQWTLLEGYWNTSTHAIRVYMNAQLKHSTDDFYHKTYSTLGISLAEIGWDIGGGDPPNIPMQFTDIYMSDSMARVVISSAPSWADRGASQELQIPLSWSNSQVQATISLGQFPSVSGKYLYLVKSDASSVLLGSFT